MKFGKQLRDRVQKEWRFYAVDYKELKQALKTDDPEESFFSRIEATAPASKETSRVNTARSWKKLKERKKVDTNLGK